MGNKAKRAKRAKRKAKLARARASNGYKEPSEEDALKEEMDALVLECYEELPHPRYEDECYLLIEMMARATSHKLSERDIAEKTRLMYENYVRWYYDTHGDRSVLLLLVLHQLRHMKEE